MKSVASYALGCKVNQYESEAIAELFSAKGYEIVNIDDEADIYVINTCTVTNFGDKKSRQLIRKVKRQNPNSIVVVAGCYAQTAPDEIMKIEGVNLVIGTKGREKIVEIIENYSCDNGVTNMVGEIMQEHEFEALEIQRLTNRTRAYLKIQDGCSQFCSYCIIPYARGPIRSRAPEEVMKEINILAENGFKEVVLTGIHVASYGKDLKNIKLLDIIKMVHNVDGIDRIRLSSIEPNIITEEFLDGIIRLNKMCRHFHLSLQSGCEKTLSAMNRKYTSSKYMESINLLRQYIPDVAITTDMIVGFPGESEEDFIESYEFAKNVGFSKIHVFPYSPKKGTSAEKMGGQIPNSIKSQRSKKLIELSDKMSKGFISKYVGETVEVLFEQEIETGIYEGHTSNYIKVNVHSEKDVRNQILNVDIGSFVGEIARGTIR